MTMLPRLQAQEQLLAINAAVLGSGSVKKRDAEKALARLDETATGERRRAKRPSVEQLKAMGIGVVRVPGSEAKNG